jgi:hypothetical protein
MEVGYSFIQLFLSCEFIYYYCFCIFDGWRWLATLTVTVLAATVNVCGFGSGWKYVQGAAIPNNQNYQM